MLRAHRLSVKHSFLQDSVKRKICPRCVISVNRGTVGDIEEHFNHVGVNVTAKVTFRTVELRRGRMDTAFLLAVQSSAFA